MTSKPKIFSPTYVSNCGLNFQLLEINGFVYVSMYDHETKQLHPPQPIEKPYTLSYHKTSFQRRFAQAYGEIVAKWETGIEAHHWHVELLKCMHNALYPNKKITNKVFFIATLYGSLSIVEYYLPWVDQNKCSLFMVHSTHRTGNLYYSFSYNYWKSATSELDKNKIKDLWKNEFPKWFKDLVADIGVEGVMESAQLKSLDPAVKNVFKNMLQIAVK